MEKTELEKRVEDLIGMSARKSVPAATHFLSPAEQYEIRKYGLPMTGGGEGCERKIAVIVPEWMDGTDIPVGDYISAVRIQSYFGEPAHRDYLGAILGLGIKREWIGDIRVFGRNAYVFCLNSVKSALLEELDRVGPNKVTCTEVSIDEVPAAEVKSREIRFTVKSMRLDAVVGCMFGLSRAKAADAIKAGFVSHNYSVCQKCDEPVDENDVVSLKGKGKGRITGIGGKSRKERTIVSAEVLI